MDQNAGEFMLLSISKLAEVIEQNSSTMLFFLTLSTLGKIFRWHVEIFSSGDNLDEILNPFFWEK